MPTIGLAVAGAVGLAGATAAVAGAVIDIGVAAGLTYLSSALSGKSSSAADSGLQAAVQVGGDQPRGCLYGQGGIAGYHAYWNTFGGDALSMLQQVYVIGDGPHDGLEAVWIYGTRYTVTVREQDAYRTIYDVDGWTHGGVSYIRLAFWHGFSDQPASPTLVEGSNPVGRWTAADRLAGVCYVHVQSFYNKTLNEGGIPDFLFEVRGRRLYDWRLDSTTGGAGPHRWSDERTWTFSRNPIVQLMDYQRGVWRGGERTLGMGIGPVDMDLDAFTGAANACDELVAESDGSSAPRYECGTYAADNEEHATVIQRFLDACGGALYERVGVYSPHAGVGQVTTYPTITDRDLVAGYEVRLTAKRPRSDLVNGLFGSYSEPAEQYEMIAYTARTDSAAEAADGEIRRSQVDFPSVHKPLQAQRLAKLQLDLARLQGTATITLGLRAVVLEPGDWIRWDSARYGNHRWLITSLRQNADQTVTLSLREISGTAYGWSEDDELDVGFGGAPAGPPPLLTTVPGMVVSPTMVVGDGGTYQPAIMVQWTPIIDDTVDLVSFECRSVATPGVVIAASTADAAGGMYIISGALQPATAYEVRGTVSGAPARATTWTAWLPVTTGDARYTISEADFAKALHNRIVARTDAEVAALQDVTAQMALAIAAADAGAALATTALDRSTTIQADAMTQRVETVTTEVGAAKAEIQRVDSTYANATEALAQRVESVTAEVVDVRGGVTEVRAGVTEVTAALATTQQAVATQTTRLDAQIQRIDANTGDIATNSASITSTQAALATTTQAVATQSSRLDAQVSRIDANTGAIATNTADISTTWAAVVDAHNSIATNTTALNARIDTANAAIGTVAASVKVTAVAAAAPAGAVAAYEIAVKVGDSAATAQGGLLIAVYGSPGAYTSKIFLRADSTSILDATGGKALFVVDGSGQAYFNVAMLNVTALSAISANIGWITAGTIVSANGKMIIDLNNNYMLCAD
ncbi:hypothetical protein V5F38_04220 [Xanthobacter sp. V0B-10]|uniref:hypothetical protein n=1 Tax=Xanthobacter albus TaxID=3119929 RepID=UPI003727DC87